MEIQTSLFKDFDEAVGFFKYACIHEALKKYGTVINAAKELGVVRSTIYKIIEGHKKDWDNYNERLQKTKEYIDKEKRKHAEQVQNSFVMKVSEISKIENEDEKFRLLVEKYVRYFDEDYIVVVGDEKEMTLLAQELIKIGEYEKAEDIEDQKKVLELK